MSDRIRKMVEMARSHVEMGGMASAGAYYRIILQECSPPKTGVERLAHGEAALWYARKSLAESRLGTATDWFLQALRADPLNNDARIRFVRDALVPMGCFKLALIEAERATKVEPENPEAWRLFGGIAHACAEVKKSVDAYDKALELGGGADALLDRCTIALDMADYATVRHCALAAIDDVKRKGDAYHLLAMADYREGKHASAIDLFKLAIKNKCYDPLLAEWNMSLAMHSIGDYRNGWLHHEARGQQKTDGGMRLVMNRFTKPRWNGEVEPSVIHVHQEMGHGDVIAMARYLPMLANLGHDVRFEVVPSMVSLMQRSFPNIKVMERSITYPDALGIPGFDYHLPMLSFPAVFETEIDTVPWHGPYLVPDPGLVDSYCEMFSGLAGPRIGLCWSSGIRNEGLWLPEYGRRKSIGFDKLWQAISNHPAIAPTNANYVSLQVGPEAKDANSFVWQWLPDEPSWDDTAALIANLDLVITVDTSVAHLAGAMGKPVWVLMHTEGSWHWMTERHDSPWYPSARLFRQKQPHQWDDVVDQVRTALAEEKQLLKIAV